MGLRSGSALGVGNAMTLAMWRVGRFREAGELLKSEAIKAIRIGWYLLPRLFRLWSKK